ncbi:uncharacterized protein LOC113297056 [Papaver somniferum]|uniref:uncharacterized protein LOC113297056 n=1 Tax=Papaver somniferum TaxID=3469 RepID=UPI000E6FA954|nr:uncharacterized protein LOC113297056 [Papaver somniferum]XP_026401240.1 uncharacterized protein LOC113297056 [Papaver somniferum]XP_026401241.1 uncharacterized protein LOC113297056 [Papaver somniferum]
MGIVKIGYRASGDGSYSGNSSQSPYIDKIEKEGATVAGADSGDDSDQELADVGCELSMVGGQAFSIPYELYDLPDLKEILSLETWNSCLTDGERFSLSAYLPDMDQQTFWLTMAELLGGKNIFFGSPVTKLFDRLKGGFYPPKVTRFREGLTFLQRRAHYQSIGLYHDNMVRTLGDMKRVWDQCQLGISIEERVYIWKSRKKGTNSLDLNAYPMNEDLLEKEVNTKTVMIPLSKKVKHIKVQEEKIQFLPPVLANGVKLAAPKPNGKGVLKLKAGGTDTFQKHVQQSITPDMWEPSRPQPKGVLRIVPKVPLVRQQPAGMEPSMFKTGEDSLLYHNAIGREAYRNPEPPNFIMDRQTVEYGNGSISLNRNLQKSIRKKKQAKDPSFEAFTDLQEHHVFEGNPGTMAHDVYNSNGGRVSSSLNMKKYAHGRQNDWQSLVRENREPSHLLSEPYQVEKGYYQEEQHMVPTSGRLVVAYPRYSDSRSGLADVGSGKHEMFPTSFDRINRHRYFNVGGSQKLHDSSAASDGLHDGAFPPVTYKRRKGQGKHNKLDYVKPLALETDHQTRIPNETINQVETGKAIKIKFKK